MLGSAVERIFRMSIKKFGQNLWGIRVNVRVTGKDFPVARQEKFIGSKLDAEERRIQLIKEIKNDNSSLKMNQSIQNFKDLIELFKEKKGNLSKSHLTKADFLKTEFGHVPLNKFPYIFENYLKIFKTTPVKRTGKPRSGVSINRYVEIARSAYNVALKLGLIQENPINCIRFPKLEESKRDRYLTEAEELKLLNSIPEHRPYLLPFIEYNLAVPCRKGELSKANRDQYNVFTNTVYIPDSKAGIPIHKPVPESMKEYFRNIPAECPYLFYREIKGSRSDRSGENVKYAPLGDFKKAFSYCLVKANITDFRIHDLRHRAVTSMIENGNNENIVADVAGWKSTKMLKNYRHINTLKSAQAITFGKPKENTANVNLMVHN